MNLVACPRCGSQFDVSTFAPGSTFQCGACRNILQVPMPAAPAAPVAPVAPVAPAAPVARAAPVAPSAPAAAPAASSRRKTAVDPRRAGGGAAKATSGRAKRIREQREESGDRKKNPLPLVAAGIAALGLGIFLVVRIRGGGDQPSEETGKETIALTRGESGTSGSPGNKGSGSGEAPGKEWKDFSDTEKLAVIQTKIKDAARAPQAAKSAVEWLEERGLKEDAKRALEAGLEKFPRDPELNRKAGRKDRTADVRTVAEDQDLLFAVENSEALDRITALQRKMQGDAGAGWLDEAASKQLDRDIAEVKADFAKMTDPVYQRSHQEFTNVKFNGAFTGLEFSFESYRPYVIFAELPGEGREDVAKGVVDATGAALQFVYRRWLSFMKDDLGMQPKPLEDQNDDRLKVFVFKSRESFDAWHARNKFDNPGPSTAAYYQHGRDRMILMHLDSFDEGVIMHEATHQIIHYFSRYFCQLDDDAINEKEGKPKEEV